MHRKRLGDRGEKLAAKYLIRNGYEIVEKNYRSPYGEVDIIAKRGDILAFIEVKTRLTDTYGSPSEAVGSDHKRRYVRAAKSYISAHGCDAVVRFDVIEIYRGEINHIENAFDAKA